MFFNPGQSALLIVVDGSESGAPHWARTARLAAALLARLPAGVPARLALLGSDLTWEAGNWRADGALPAAARGSGSFLAPVLAAVNVRRQQYAAIAVLGSGDVFDLPDWIALHPEMAWALARTGPESLQPIGLGLPELDASAARADLPALASALLAQLTALPASARRSTSLSGFVRHRWELDRSGYPLVYVEPLRLFWQLFPLARPQFEHFLAEARPPGWGDAWYAGFLEAGLPRRSACDLAGGDYEPAFVTGLLPTEVQAYSGWHGKGLRPPSVAEWRTAWRWLAEQSASIPPAELERSMSLTAACLWQGLLERLHPATLLDLSLMRGGVLEWVTEPGGEWLGMGQPRPGHHVKPFHNPLSDDPHRPTSLDRRSRWFGFRPFWSE